jgi:CheY-like chemotaxis protein
VIAAWAAGWRLELARLRASPWDLGLMTLAPLLALVLLGALFHASSPDGLPIAVVDADHSATSRELTAAAPRAARHRSTRQRRGWQGLLGYSPRTPPNIRRSRVVRCSPASFSGRFFMSGIPALLPLAPSSRLGAFRAWLKARSTEIWESPEDLPIEAGVRMAHFYGPVRVLVVDDNPVNLMLISVLLESRGLVPVLAADGAEAVALACEQQFDLILMDLQMPILGGLEATSAIRLFESDRSRPAAPVVAYSGTPPGAGVLATHGLNGSLSKPCGDQELEDCLVQWCPTYRSAPAVQGAAHDNGYWQSAGGASGASSVWLR